VTCAVESGCCRCWRRRCCAGDVPSRTGRAAMTVDGGGVWEGNAGGTSNEGRPRRTGRYTGQDGWAVRRPDEGGVGDNEWKHHTAHATGGVIRARAARWCGVKHVGMVRRRKCYGAHETTLQWWCEWWLELHKRGRHRGGEWCSARATITGGRRGKRCMGWGMEQGVPHNPAVFHAGARRQH
jgi:hypothetical protein